jgi:hypothetical protein
VSYTIFVTNSWGAGHTVSIKLINWGTFAVSTVFENMFGAKVGHPALFRDLCRHLELDKKTCKVLTQITTDLNLEKPAMIFVDPSALREGVKLPSVTESVELIRELYFKWFGGAI